MERGPAHGSRRAQAFSGGVAALIRPNLIHRQLKHKAGVESEQHKTPECRVLVVSLSEFTLVVVFL